MNHQAASSLIFKGKYDKRGGELDPTLSRRFAFGIIPNPDISGLDNLAYKFHSEI
jgi:hypothetical protein